MPMRILIIDEQAVFRTGLRELIVAKIPGVEVLVASSLAQAISCELPTNTFDLVLVGAGRSNSGAFDSLTAAREVLPTARLAIISAADTRADIIASLAARSHGFISKRQSDTEITEAIRDILAGRIYVPSFFAQDDGKASRDDKVAAPPASIEVDLSQLTKRQREVLQLLVQGMSNKEIARVLKIAEATTKIHMAALIRAFGVRNRTEAAFKAASLVKLSKPGSAEPAKRARQKEPSDQALD
ncbi:MAG: response regulator transcription factor [Xanthobacteraceae bacterium]